MESQNKHYFINDEGLNCYQMECGCEGVELPGFGWKNILCEECEELQEDFMSVPIKYKQRKFNDRDSI
jgi:GTP-binding protein EngB required for normal cell division